MADDFRQSLDLVPADMERIDKLFQMTQRGPFSGMRPEEVLSEVAGFPLAPGGITEDMLLPLMIQGYVLGGVWNDRFIQGPPDGDASAIDDISNKLPGWSFVDSSAAGAQAFWEIELNDSPHLDFEHDTGSQTDGDEVYIEQYAFVPGGNITILAPSFHAYTDNTTDWAPFMEVQWVYPDGTLAGSATRTEYTGVASGSGGAIHRTWLMSRTRHYAFLRMRMGFTAKTTGAGGTQIGHLLWAWMETPESYDVTLRFGRGDSAGNWTPSASNTYNIQLNDISQTYAAAKWIAPSPGLVLAISCLNDHGTGVTAGTFQWIPRVAGAQLSDPVAEFNSTNQLYALDQRDLEGVTAFDFARGDKIDLQAVTNGSYAGPAANWSGTLSLRLVFDNAEDATGGGIGPAGG
jgi:hypothetical protein